MLYDGVGSMEKLEIRGKVLNKEYFDSDHYEIVILDAYGKGVPRVGGTKAYRPSIRVYR